MRYTNVTMWAKRTTQRGFTIVELLIVIVIIGILAAITIVAYNGVTNRAKVTAIQSDLSQGVKQLEIAKIDSSTSSYPASLPSSIKASSGNVYTYTPVPDQQSYCLQSANGSLNSFVTGSSTSPQDGVCAITNRIPNPSFEAGTIPPWLTAMKNSDTALISSAQEYASNYALAITTASNTVDSYVEYPLALTAGTYTVSAYVYLTTTGTTYSSRDAMLYNQNGGLSATPGVVAYDRTKLNQWQRVSATFTTTTAGTLGVRFYGGAGGVTYVDAIMVTSGTATYKYVDPILSTTWTWAGTINNSASSGPAI